MGCHDRRRAEMMGEIVHFPDPRGSARTPEQWHEDLLALHGRLMAALTKERKQVDVVRMVLTIDEVMDLAQLIEDKLGPDFFDNEAD